MGVFRCLKPVLKGLYTLHFLPRMEDEIPLPRSVSLNIEFACFYWIQLDSINLSGSCKKKKKKKKRQRKFKDLKRFNLP